MRSIEDREKMKYLINNHYLHNFGDFEIHGPINLEKIYAKDENEMKKLQLLVDKILKSNGYDV